MSGQEVPVVCHLQVRLSRHQARLSLRESKEWVGGSNLKKSSITRLESTVVCRVVCAYVGPAFAASGVGRSLLSCGVLCAGRGRRTRQSCSRQAGSQPCPPLAITAETTGQRMRPHLEHWA